MKRIELVDYLRGISIFTIVLMHLCQSYTNGALSKALAFGGAGVHVFILCSGFGLYLSYLRKPLEYRDFLQKRFAKVYSPYAVAVLMWGIWMTIETDVFPTREVISHLLLYKMFSVDLDISLCYPYWFISTIIQFYLAWPLVIRLVRGRGGHFLPIVISIAWSTLVGVLGYEEARPWGSFFLQYLWEFCLGMWVAERIYNRDEIGKIAISPRQWKWWWLLCSAAIGMGLTGLMAWNGGILKLYNDIPSLVGYLSVLLIVYKVGIYIVNRFFIWASGFGYELYLVHTLVFVVLTFSLSNCVPLFLLLTISLVAAYVTGYGYSCLLRLLKLK